MIILGIESTCDETAASLVEDGRHLLSNVISTSVKEQALYGGVVPEIASRRHCEFISATVKKALLDAGKTIDDVDAVAVTFAPGLIGAVLVGVNFAKGLAYSAGKPLVPVHHLRGHIAALYLTHPELKPPFLCLVASGGHSHIVEVQDYTHYHILGHTVDDAAGEAFDKVARTLGLPYPGGPSVANAAKTGDPKAYRLPVPHVEGKYNVSFSGLKTAVLNEVNQAQMNGTDINVPDLAASFQERIAGILAEKLLLAAADTGAKQVCLAGGVAANGRLRQLVNDGAQKLGAKVRGIELSLRQRCAAHCASKTDVDESYMAGKAAVENAVAGKTDYMPGFKCTRDENGYKCEIELLPLSEVANTEKKVPREWINEEGNGVTQEFVDYALPLINGENVGPKVSGLPRFANLKKIKAEA